MSIELIAAIGAFLTGIASLIGAIMLNRKTTALMEYRLGKVEAIMHYSRG